MWIIPADAKKPADDRAFHVVQKKEKAVKPFLKWAGGKGQLLPEIERYYPFDDKAITRYAEPFVGGGAVLFDILGKYSKNTLDTATSKTSTLSLNTLAEWGY